jgi:hypothetical protein
MIAKTCINKKQLTNKEIPNHFIFLLVLFSFLFLIMKTTTTTCGQVAVHHAKGERGQRPKLAVKANNRKSCLPDRFGALRANISWCRKCDFRSFFYTGDFGASVFTARTCLSLVGGGCAEACVPRIFLPYLVLPIMMESLLLVVWEADYDGAKRVSLTAQSKPISTDHNTFVTKIRDGGLVECAIVATLHVTQ